jgi:hypothetical protein
MPTQKKTRIIILFSGRATRSAAGRPPEWVEQARTRRDEARAEIDQRRAA